MTIIKQAHYEVLPVGEYVARIGEVEETEGTYGAQFKIRFDLQDANLGREIIGWCSQAFSPKSKLYGWARAAFGGREIPTDYDLDTAHLLGKPVRLVLVQRLGEDGQTFNKIDAVLPYRSAPAATPTPEPTPQPVAVNVGWPDTEPPADDEELPF